MPTALELTREEWQTYIEAARLRPPQGSLSPFDQMEREKLLARIQEAAEILKSHFGASKVFLFGSLASIEWFTQDSDVDLAVEGLKASDYWKAWRLTEDIIGDRLVDFIELETAGESLKKTIQRSGVEL
ncbi:MAG: DNA polymerase [Deltaproteobacteria bacterium HGW-Deltaproteobacteria-21]|nr:MAG: DNA polymerase [Deltaproteobacteria bacterium HGW-Deltaproteobacteria-21]